MDYADQLDMMDDDCDIEGFPLDDRCCKCCHDCNEDCGHPEKTNEDYKEEE